MILATTALFGLLIQGPTTVLLSDVRINKGSGDVIGAEASLRVHEPDKVVASVRYYEGSCSAEAIELHGTIRGQRLSMRGEFSSGTVRLEGVLTKKQFVGRLSFQLSSQTNTVELRLPVVKSHKLCR